MKVVQTHGFRRMVKKLHPNQKRSLDQAIRQVAAAPEAGACKKGDLAGLRVLKFRMAGQPCLLGYVYDDAASVLTLIALGPHENFYRDLKR